MDPWFRRAPGLVTVLSSDLLLEVNLPKVANALSQTNPDTELLAAQHICQPGKDRRSADGLCPGYSREDVVLITNLKNLSVYYQKAPCVALSGKSRTHNRVATYQSSNDDYVIEEYGMIAMIDGVTFAVIIPITWRAASPGQER